MAVASSERLQLIFTAKDLVSGPTAEMATKTAASIAKIENAVKSQKSSAAGPAAGKELDTSRQRAQLRTLEESARAAALGVGRVGAELTSAFGPAGGLVRDVAGEVLSLGGGFDVLVGKLGISRGALLALGVGGAVLAALTAGVGALVSQASDAEKKLLGVAAASKDPAAAVAAVEAIADRVRERLGGALADDDILKLAALAFREAGQQSGEAYANALRASVVAALGGGDPVGAFKALDSVFQNFKVDAGAVPDQLDRIDSIAKSANVSVLALFDSIDAAAPTAGSLGQRLDAVAAAAAGAKRSGANLEEVGRGLTGLFGVLGDKTNTARLRLEGLGLKFEDAAGSARPLLDVVDDLGALVDKNKNLLFELFPADRVRREISKIIEGVDLARGALLEAATAGGGFEASARGALNLPSLSLGRTGEGLSTTGKDLGRGALGALGSAFGTPIKLPTEVQIPDNIRDLQRAFLEAANAGAGAAASGFVEQIKGELARAEVLFAEQAAKARAAFAETVRSDPASFGGGQEDFLSVGLAEQIDKAKQIADFKPGGLDLDAFRRAILDVEQLNAELSNTSKLIDGATGRAFKFALTPDLKLDRVFIDDAAKAAAALPPVKTPAELVLSDDGIQASIRKVLDRTDIASLPVKLRVLPPDVENARKFLDSLPDTANVRENLSPDQQAAYDKATAALERFRTELEAIAALDADIAARSQTGPERIAADAQKRARDVRKRLAESPIFTKLDPNVSAGIFAGADAIEEKGRQDAASARARATAEASARLLGLKVQLLDRERALAAAVGFTADSEGQAARALSDRAKLQRELVLAQIAAQRAATDPKDTAALDALKEQEDILLRIADAESAAAAAAFDRARIERSQRTGDLVSDAGDSLRVGLDREYAAIERNRAAKIKAAEDGVRAGTLDADALARLLPLYDAIADRDRARAERAAGQRDAEDIAGLIRETSGLYADQAAALDLLRAVERDRYAETLKDEGLTQDAIRERLKLFDQLTARQKQTLAIQFSRTPAVQLALDGLDETAFQRAQEATDRIVQGLIAAEAPAEQIGKALEEGMQRGLDAIADARTGMDALVTGWKAGWRDFLREVNDDASFGARASGQLGGGFRDSLSSAFQGKRNDGESIGQTFLRSNLENVQKQAADFAANKVSAAIFGPLFGEKDKPSTPDERLLAASTTFDEAVKRFAAAVDASPGANFALSPPPDSIRAPGFGPVDFPQNDFVSLPPGVDPGLAAPAADSLAAAGEDFSATVGAGAQSAASAIVQGGDAFGAGITGVVGALGNQLGGFLTSLLGGGAGGLLGFAEGGVIQGSLRPYTPHRAQYGRVVRQRTLIEVAENPGLEEAIIPLRGGAVPVTLSRREDPRARQNQDRDATTELVQAMRGRAVAAEREARQQRTEKAGTTVNVAGSTVSLSVTVQGGGSGNAGAELVAAMPEIEKRLTAAIELGTNRRLINAIRGA